MTSSQSMSQPNRKIWRHTKSITPSMKAGARHLARDLPPTRQSQTPGRPAIMPSCTIITQYCRFGPPRLTSHRSLWPGPWILPVPDYPSGWDAATCSNFSHGATSTVLVASKGYRRYRSRGCFTSLRGYGDSAALVHMIASRSAVTLIAVLTATLARSRLQATGGKEKEV